jgi:hypothetical protein
MNFKEYKEYLTEISKRELLSKTDKDRIQKAVKNMSVRPPKIKELDSGLERIEYNAKMNPPKLSTEKKNHRGYIDYDPKTKDIKQMYCDCKSFNYEVYQPMVKADLATWDLPKFYKRRIPFKNNKEAPVEKNPDNTIYVCKHLAAVLIGYF